MPRYRPLARKDKGIKYFIDYRAEREDKPGFYTFESSIKLQLNMSALMKIMAIKSYPAIKGWLVQYRDEYVSKKEHAAFNKRYHLGDSDATSTGS